jgi:hypothetical protein
MYTLSLVLLLTHTSIFMRMANYIYTILKSNRIVLWSWGFEKPQALLDDEGLIFHVNGFKHNGFVKVVYHEGKDLFVVILLDIDKKELQRIDDIFFDSLIDVIDESVERTTDYNP